MSAPFRSASVRLAPTLFIGFVGWKALEHLGPVHAGPEILPLPALAAAVVGVCAIKTSRELLLFAGNGLHWMRARRAIGLKGTAGWIIKRREITPELKKRGWGPYWGVFKGREIIADYASNALTLGPAGTGKGVGCVMPTILAIRHSKTVIDFKGELSAVLSDVLRTRGETVRIINLGDLWTEIIGASDAYNPLCLIVDDFWRPGGLQDVSDDLHEMAMQLYPEPAKSGHGGDNLFFRDGSRGLIAFAIVACVLVYGEGATLGHVAELLYDRESLLRDAQWVAGRLKTESGVAIMPIQDSPWVDRHDPLDVENFITYIRGIAGSVADLLDAEDSRTADSFITGAQQALARFNITTRAHKKTGRNSFRFADQKADGRPVTVFIVADASRIEAQAPVLGLLQWCALTEWKRHPNKHKPVYLVADEATNFKISGLDSLLTWGRGFGIRLHLILQSFSAFERVYSRETLKTLLSETEIKQFLAGQREPETLRQIAAILAEASWVVQGHRGARKFGVSDLDGFDYREEARPLMTPDEIRRTDKTILIIRRARPMLVELPPIAAIAPWRKQIAVNPFHGKPYLLPVRLRLHHRDGPLPLRMIRRLWSHLSRRTRP